MPDTFSIYCITYFKISGFPWQGVRHLLQLPKALTPKIRDIGFEMLLGKGTNRMDSPQLKRRRFKKIAAAALAAAAAMNALHITI
jgi:hypothetical protein